MTLISPNFGVKWIIFSQFWPGAFSQICWKKPCSETVSWIGLVFINRLATFIHFMCFFAMILNITKSLNIVYFLYPATKVWRGIMLYPSVSVRLSVRPSVRPCSPFPIDNLSIYSRIFFKFCIHIVIGDEWYGIVNGQNPSIFNGVTALFRIGKMVSGLLFLYCS